MLQRGCPDAAGPGKGKAFDRFTRQRRFALTTTAMNGDDRRALIAAEHAAKLRQFIDTPLESSLRARQSDGLDRRLVFFVDWRASDSDTASDRPRERRVEHPHTNGPSASAAGKHPAHLAHSLFNRHAAPQLAIDPAR